MIGQTKRKKISEITDENFTINVSNKGRVISSKGIKTYGHQGVDGYFRTSVFELSFGIHELVFAAFIGPIPKGFTVDHKDRQKGNNGAENLRAATKSEQSQNRQKSENTSYARPITATESGQPPKRFRTSRDASVELGIPQTSILRACHSGSKYHQYTFEFESTEPLPDEQWLPVSWIDGCKWMISNMGRCKRNNGTITFGVTSATGYKTVTILGHPYRVHNLVGRAFICILLPGQSFDHCNAIRDDNRACNLRPATRSEQTSFSYANNPFRKPSGPALFRKMRYRAVGASEWIECESQKAAAASMGVKTGAIATAISRGKPTAHGFEFEYISQPDIENELWIKLDIRNVYEDINQS